MPKMRDSQRVLTDKEVGNRQALPQAQFHTLPPDPLAVSPFMASSVPNRASNFDAFQRQFYRTGVPMQRILIPNLE